MLFNKLKIVLMFSISTILLFLSPVLSAQDGVFAYAYNPNGKALSLESADDKVFGDKYTIAQEILDDLVEAKGSLNRASPKLIMNNAEQRPASINLLDATITIEQKAYDICLSMGEDFKAALALLIAHELTHYYENHDWKDHFLHAYGENLTESKSKLKEDHLGMELEADQLGGFLANMAGYNSSGILEKLLPKLYEAYHLKPEGNSKYPTLEERISLALKGEEELGKMQYAFEMSNYLTAVGEYESAFNYLDYIVVKSKFQSREIHNNRGALLALSALTFFSQTEMPFIVPLEFDTDSRLSRRASNKEIREEYLNKAEASVKKALMVDKNYYPAYVNLASIYIMKGEYFDAEYQCQKIIRNKENILDQSQVAYAHINMGIIRYMEGKVEEARTNFDLAKDYELHEIANFNIGIIEETNPSSTINKIKKKLVMDEFPLKSLYSRIMRDEEEANLSLNISDLKQFHLIKKDSSEILVNMEDFGDEGFQFFHKGTSILIDGKQFTTSSKRKEIEDFVGQQSHLILLPSGLMRVYLDNQFIIKFDKRNRIKEFIIAFKE